MDFYISHPHVCEFDLTQHPPTSHKPCAFGEQRSRCALGLHVLRCPSNNMQADLCRSLWRANSALKPPSAVLQFQRQLFCPLMPQLNVLSLGCEQILKARAIAGTPETSRKLL